MSDIVFISDFGTSDWYVAAMKGVAHGFAPDAGMIDLTHDIAPGNIPQADFILGQAAPCFPRGTVFCVVIDPQVGSDRRILVASNGAQRFVAPDNGVLSTVAHEAGDRWVCHQALNKAYFRPMQSRTFHGRDVFAPVAAWLIRGTELALFGPAIHDAIMRPSAHPLRMGVSGWQGMALHIDRFGNIITCFRKRDEPFASKDSAEATLRIKDKTITGVKNTYADVEAGEFLLYWGSSEYLEIGINRGSAGDVLGVRAGEPVAITFA